MVLALVFGSGMLVGYVADGSRGVEAAMVPSDSVASPAAKPTRRSPVYEQLHPTPEQTERIDSILRDHRDQMVEIHEELRAAREA